MGIRAGLKAFATNTPALGIGGSFVKGMLSPLAIKSTAKHAGVLAGGMKGLANKGLTADTLLKMGKSSAVLMGRASGITMGARMVTGRNPVKDRSGRTNIPFLPFV